jgi:hypothetical protein
MGLSKPKHPSIQEHGPRVQDHMAMNAWVLNNLLAWSCHNEQKAIARTRRHALLEWDMLQVDLQYTPEVFKPTFMRLTFNLILWLLSMITWGAGAILLNMQTKLECNEDLAIVIRVTQTRYAKAFKGGWMEPKWKFASNKIVQQKEIGFLTQYDDSKMIQG